MSNLAGAVEAVVVSLAINGDIEAFDELVRRKQANVRTLMRRLANDATLAEDLSQQVFVEVWKSLRSLQSAAAFSGWLRSISANVWLQHFRKKNALLFDNDVVESAMDSNSNHDHGRDMDLKAALSLLPAPVRLCVVLAYQEGMSHQEIAQVASMPLGTVKSHITRGSARLREILSDYGNKS